MDIDDQGVASLAENVLFHQAFTELEGAIGLLVDEHPALEVDNCDFFAIGQSVSGGAAPDGSAGVVGGADDFGAVGEEFFGAFLVERVVAQRNHIHACGEDFVGGFKGYPAAVGGVFAVGDDHIEGMLLAQSGQELAEGFSAWGGGDIAKKKNFHEDFIAGVGGFGQPFAAGQGCCAGWQFIGHRGCGKLRGDWAIMVVGWLTI